jgi:hypothetical protein
MLLNDTFPAYFGYKVQRSDALYWLKIAALGITGGAAVSWFFGLFFAGGSSSNIGRAVGMTVWALFFWILFGLAAWLKRRKRNSE